ncbi:50S ribosomal protein L18 [Candidatus Collierbacteria bacterium]|nr:50S ribosomal protein L18 [Candidatus Collierbacteria bacterium]
MINRYKTINDRRKAAARKKLLGVGNRPRLAVHRSAQHIYCQIIDVTGGKILAAASDLDLKSKEKLSKTSRSTAVGEILAQKAKKSGVTKVMFDRGAYKYHGRVKALAEAARKGGLEF